MSWLSKGIKGLGHIAEKALPYAGLIPGVGGVVGAGASFLSRALGHNAAPAVPSGTTDMSDPNFNMDQLYGSDPALGGSGILNTAVDAAKTATAPGPAGSTNPWLLGLAGLQGANSAYLGQKANALSNKALTGVEANYAARAPLRAKGLAGLLNPTAPDTTQLSTIAQRNPYSAPPLPVA